MLNQNALDLLELKVAYDEAASEVVKKALLQSISIDAKLFSQTSYLELRDELSKRKEFYATKEDIFKQKISDLEKELDSLDIKCKIQLDGAKAFIIKSFGLSADKDMDRIFGTKDKYKYAGPNGFLHTFVHLRGTRVLSKIMLELREHTIFKSFTFSISDGYQHPKFKNLFNVDFRIELTPDSTNEEYSNVAEVINLVESKFKFI